MTGPCAEVIGDPIDHSKSPLIHNFWLQKLNIAADYRACHVLAEGLEHYLAGRRGEPAWRGCNVTIPHKQAVMPHLDEIDERARGVGAVNTVIREPDGTLLGTNTDVDGVADAIAPGLLGDATAVVIGAGGAARAAFAFLSGAGLACVKVLARDPGKAAEAARSCELDAEVLRFAADSHALEGATLLINATQLGMTGQVPMPGFILEELASLADEALVFDMVYAPLETALLATARRRGLATADGLVMLIGQAATAFERFFGLPPPREADAELRALLTA